MIFGWFKKKTLPAYSIVSEEHANFYRALSALRYIKASDYEGVKILLKDVRDTLEEDFRIEDELMEKLHYPEANLHKLHHEVVLKMIDIYCHTHGILDKDEIVEHIRNWMLNHTKHSDKKLQRYLFDANRLLVM